MHISQPVEPGVVIADDFESGTRAAIFGGLTTMLPFCLQARGQSLREAVTWYHGLAESNCYCDVSFHLIVTDPTPVNGGVKTGHVAAQNQASVRVPSAMALALPK